MDENQRCYDGSAVQSGSFQFRSQFEESKIRTIAQREPPSLDDPPGCSLADKPTLVALMAS